MFDEKFSQELHHSYLIEGDPIILPNELLSFLESRGDIKIKSSDVLFQIHDSFTVDESRFVILWNNEQAIGDKKICIIGAKSLTHEAQHSLLKMLEEPATNTHFFLILPNIDTLLPTLKSRAQSIKVDEKESLFYKKQAELFINMNTEERLAHVAKIIKDHEDDESSASLRQDAIYLLSSIESAMYKNFKKNINSKELEYALVEIQKCREFASTPGASVKMLLEHIALVI